MVDFDGTNVGKYTLFSIDRSWFTGESKNKTYIHTSNVPTISMGSTTTTEFFVKVIQRWWQPEIQKVHSPVEKPAVEIPLLSHGFCASSQVVKSADPSDPTFQGTKNHQTPETGGVGAGETYVFPETKTASLHLKNRAGFPKGMSSEPTINFQGLQYVSFREGKLKASTWKQADNKKKLSSCPLSHQCQMKILALW